MSGMDRRRFLKVTAITGTSAALAGCGNPEHQLMRFVPEEEITPGIAVWKPSVCPLCSAGCGVLARVMDGDAEVFRNGQPGVTRMGLPRKLEGDPRAPGEPGPAVRARPGGAAGHLSPRSPHRAAAPQRRARQRQLRRRCRGTTRWPIWPAGSMRWSAQGQAGAIAFLGRPRRGRRPALVAEFLQPARRAGAGRLRALRRRGVPPRQRAQLRPLPAADLRPGAIALRHRLRRRLPRHLELAAGAERRLRPHAPGPAGHPRQVRADRTAGLADRGQRRRMGDGAARHRGRRGPGPGPRHPARRPGAGVRRRPRRGAHRRAGRPDCRRSRRPRSRSGPGSRRRESSGWPASSPRTGRRWRSSAGPRWPTPTGSIRRWPSTR